MKTQFLAAVLLSCFAFQLASATLGVDISGSLCNGEGQTLGNWQCLKNNGYNFGIIQAWQGGYGWTSGLPTCVAQAWAAGFAHVDVYIFMCPNCRGNADAAGVVSQVVNNLRSNNVNFGMIWFDVEQCDGCWNDAASNVQWYHGAVNQAISMGVNFGFYSSEYEYQQTFGGATDFSQYPLWYAHYDGSASFSDSWAYQFGGWTRPAMKQYNDQGPCMTVDVNWYPDSADEAEGAL